MKSIIYFSLLLIGLEVHCHPFQGLNEKQNSSPEHHHLLRKNQTKLPAYYKDFAIKLYKHIASGSARKNNLTSKEDFFVDEATVVKVNMMNQNGHYKYLHDEELSCWVVRIPYEGEEATAWFILPDEGKLREVESALSRETMRRWGKSFKNDREVHLYIPKLAVSAFYDVKDLLQRLGTEDVFSDNADLSGNTGQRNRKVFEAVHKAVPGIHKRSTEEEAVTAQEVISRRGCTPFNITFNRPFMMAMVEQGTILYTERIVNPNEN